MEEEWLCSDGVRWCVVVCRGGFRVGGEGAFEEWGEGVCGAKMKNLMNAPIRKTIVSCPRKKPWVNVKVEDMIAGVPK